MSSYAYRSTPRDDRAERLRLRELAAARPRYGVNRLHVLMRREGWAINHKKTERIYKEEKLWVRTKKVRRRKLVAVARVAPAKAEYVNQIWTMDFVHDQLEDGRKIRCLTLVDKLSREALCIDVNYRLPIARCRRGAERGEVVATVARNHLRRQWQRIHFAAAGAMGLYEWGKAALHPAGETD